MPPLAGLLRVITATGGVLRERLAMDDAGGSGMRAALPKLAYSVAEACAVSSLGRSTIYSHISAGRLKARRVGGRRIILADSLHALIAGDG